LIKNKQYINVNDLDEWKNTILSKIYLQIDKLNDYKVKNSETVITNDNKNKTEIKIESKNELNCFTSKDIQEENKDITRTFQNETYNYMNITEKVENDIAAFFLKDVARISRIAYNEGKNVLK
jgi:putative sterol carrier protein